jgi:hypothetical protein
MGGTNPHWRRDGKEMFFMNGSALMHATVTATAAAVDIGAAEPLFDLGSRLPPPIFPISNVFDVSPDGQRFLFILPRYAAPEVLTLVVNWPALLRP